MNYSHSAHLHATGYPELDILTVEHNDFLLDRDHEAEVRAAMLDYWLERVPKTTEISLMWLADSRWLSAMEHAALAGLLRKQSIHRSYAIHLDEVREAKLDYLNLIGPNCRRHIRRAFREYRMIGEVVVEVASSVEQGLDWFARLGELHQARWLARGHPGSFSNEFFTRFHRALIERNLDQGGIQLLRIRTGKHPIGYIYSFVRQGRVFVYQTGMDYGLPGKNARPGLVSHVMAVRYNAAAGHEVYDLMAGDSRYKCELSTLDEWMTCMTLRTASWRFELEETMPRVVSVLHPVRRVLHGIKAAGCSLMGFIEASQ